MLSAWTLGGHLLLRCVDDSSGAPATPRKPAAEPNRRVGGFYYSGHKVLMRDIY
jgi:hypothetical protein